jgi:hypothetical protein
MQLHNVVKDFSMQQPSSGGRFCLGGAGHSSWLLHQRRADAVLAMVANHVFKGRKVVGEALPEVRLILLLARRRQPSADEPHPSSAPCAHEDRPHGEQRPVPLHCATPRDAP